MPADHASGRFALLMNAMSRKTFPLGTTAALSLLISTAAHAEQCGYGKTSVMVLAQATTVSPATACILDEITMRKAAATCSASAKRDPASDVAGLPAQQPAAR